MVYTSIFIEIVADLRLPPIEPDARPEPNARLPRTAQEAITMVQAFEAKNIRPIDAQQVDPNC